MAIWQYFLKVIPEQSVIDKFGGVPAKLSVEQDSDQSAFAIDWWKAAAFDRESVFSEINKLIDRCGWDDSETFFGWKGDVENNEDNDVYILFDESGRITDFTFRTDLRGNTIDFLEGVLEICKQNDWLVMDARGNLMSPALVDVFESMKKSDAKLFLDDPQNLSGAQDKIH